MRDSGDDSPSRHGEGLSTSVDAYPQPPTPGISNYAFADPDHFWQHRIRGILNTTADVQYNNAPAASAQYGLPSRQLNSLVLAQEQHQQPSLSRAHHPIVQTADLSVPYSAKLMTSGPADVGPDEPGMPMSIRDYWSRWRQDSTS